VQIHDPKWSSMSVDIGLSRFSPAPRIRPDGDVGMPAQKFGRRQPMDAPHAFERVPGRSQQPQGAYKQVSRPHRPGRLIACGIDFALTQSGKTGAYIDLSCACGDLLPVDRALYAAFPNVLHIATGGVA
jgi:hypothetical protein